MVLLLIPTESKWKHKEELQIIKLTIFSSAFRKLYWSDWDRSNPKIEFSDLDGTGRELLLGSDSVKLPNSLVVLEHSGELCFADAGNKKVECIDSQSRQIRTISQDLSYPFGLTFTHDQFYWTDWTT